MVRSSADATCRDKLHICNKREEHFTGSVTRFLLKVLFLLKLINYMFFCFSVKKLGELGHRGGSVG